MTMCIQLLSRVWFFVTPGTVAHQAPLSMGVSKEEYWSGLPSPPPGDLPHQGSNLCVLCLLPWEVNCLPLCHLGSPYRWQYWDSKGLHNGPVPKKGNAKECSNYCTIATISHASKVMLKILQAKLQYYVNCELLNVQAGFRKGRGTRDQIANIRWIIEKAREFQENIYFCFIDYTKAFDCVDHNKLWKILQEMGIPDHLTCLLRNLYATHKATVRTGHGTDVPN